MQPDKAALEELVAVYSGAWSEPDGARRQGLLDRAWAEDGTYTDPTASVVGRTALVEHIGRFLQQYPGAQVVPTSAVDAHHGRLRFTWRVVLADGKVFAEGVDFGALSPDGKLASIVGFFGPLAPGP